MTLRDAIWHNFGWKVLSLLLGMLVWYFVNSSIAENTADDASAYTMVFQRPVSVIAPGLVGANVKVNPPEVRVTVRGSKDVLVNVNLSDIAVFVDLSGDVKTPTKTYRTVQVSLPAGVSKVSVVPSTVSVEFTPNQKAAPDSFPPS